MSQCQACAGRATVSLCPTCTSKLRDLLEHLPQWITHLEEAALGQVRLGDGGGGRSTARRQPFKGDDEALAQCTCGHAETSHDDYYVTRDGNMLNVQQGCTAIDRDDEAQTETPCNCREYRPRMNQAKMRAQLLAAGRINTRAADLLDAVRNSLTTWTRHLGETRGIVFVRPGFIGPLLPGHVRLANTTPAIVAFLAENVGAIACDESAGECLAELEDHVRAIEKVINRPLATLFLGECPTWNEQTRKVCGTELNCREGTIEITCSKCRQTHKTDRLQLLMMSDLARKKLTVAEILALNARLPEDERTPERTLRRWVRTGPNGEAPELKPNGYLRPCSCGHARVHHGKSGCTKCGSSCTRFDGREVINRHSEDDETLHKYADVRRLRVERPKRAARVVKTA